MTPKFTRPPDRTIGYRDRGDVDMGRTTAAIVTMLVLGGCGGGDRAEDDSTSAGPSTTSPTAATSSTTTTDLPTTGDPGTATQAGSDTSVTTPTTDASTSAAATTVATDSTGGVLCADCDEPNQVCQDGQCTTLCQGQDPSPCPVDQLCDVISGECKPVDDPCVLAGPATPCDSRSCGPGSVCDDQGSCVPVAPCVDVACTGQGACWGTQCGCERPIACADPTLEALNGPFSDKIIGIDFADDCTAWMVTLRDGVDYLRRLLPSGDLSEWPGVSNLDMGEVKVLRSLTIPQLTVPLPWTDEYVPPAPVEGLGEVALTYTCIGGCLGMDPQGVAHLVEDDPNNPLPIVIIAAVTTGNGPFGVPVADAGPQGLTWGVDRVLYVG